MTVLAEEAAPAARAARRPRPRPNPTTGRVTGTMHLRASNGSPQQVRPLPPPRQESRAPAPAPARRGRTLPDIPGGKVTGRNYQGVILAEFVAAIVLTAASPIASKRNTPGLSPYAAADVAQLAALTLVYLILALISTGSRGAGRISAWVGGLMLLVVGLGEASTIAKTLDIFGSPTGAGAGVASGSAGTINPNAPATSPAQPNPATGG